MDSSMRHRLLLVLTIATAGACTAPGPRVSDGAPVTGRWGGVHADLTLTDTGGAIEYDCAHGGLAAPIRPDRDGRFEIAGVHVREHGGPSRIGEVPDAVPARYLGRIAGNRMTLRVLVGADTLGVFDLRQDAQAQLFKCL
jgi:hypothetical protein